MNFSFQSWKKDSFENAVHVLGLGYNGETKYKKYFSTVSK